MLKYYGKGGWYQPLLSWDCEGSSFSDARATGTGQDRPSLAFSPECWAYLSVLWVFAMNITLFLLHVPFHPFLNTLFTVPPLFLYFSFCDAVFPSLDFFFLILYILNIQNGLKSIKCTWTFWQGSVRSQVEVLQITWKIGWNLHSLLTITKVAFWHAKIFLSLGCFRSRERLLYFCDFISDSIWNNLSNTAPILSFQKVNQPFWCKNYWYSIISMKHIPPISYLPTHKLEKIDY